MLWPDVIRIKEFYASRLGQMSCRLLRRRMRAFWPSVAGDAVAGIGFATPFLSPLAEEARHTVALMPASQGVIHWPQEKPNLAALVYETELPLRNESVERVIVAHALEHTGQPMAMLAEIWRVLEPGGRLLAVVPNRRGIWARLESTPFGAGYPFSPSQLKKMLKDARLTPARHATALFTPPNASRLLLRSARAVEEIGARFFPFLGGVIVMEAEKQIYAIRPRGTPERVARPALAPQAVRGS